ncbi:MAG: YqgE/AlgH family protein, partial [Hyphomicrobiales bacterium]|nr:YqgE/AlgH family protein [Hyphomicrobiales bacterium]
GAMGIVINHAAPSITFTNLLEQLDIINDHDVKDVSTGFPVNDMIINTGGPVETGRGFVLHTTDYFSADSTLTIDDMVSLTATVDILRAIATGKGPMRSLLALGYAGWASGQLEHEIQTNGWLVCPADNDLIFNTDLDKRYDLAMAKLGIHPSFLVSDTGNA